MTRQGKMILETLKSAGTHLTADEVYDSVKKSVPRISLATVYRNLEKLTEHGLIQRAGRGAKRRYDARLDRHYHIRCILCDALDDLPPSPVVEVEAGYWDNTGFDVLGHELEFVGICPDCRKKGHDYVPVRSFQVRR